MFFCVARKMMSMIIDQAEKPIMQHVLKMLTAQIWLKVQISKTARSEIPLLLV